MNKIISLRGRIRMNNNNTISKWNEYFIDTYNQPNFVIDYGEGSCFLILMAINTQILQVDMEYLLLGIVIVI